MKRVPEPELMEEEAQAIAYAAADFNESDAMFVDRFAETFDPFIGGTFLDLGCGPGNIAFRLARHYPDSSVHAVDGAAAMLAQGAAILAQSGDIKSRVELIQGFIPDAALPLETYAAVVSNSLLHHLPDPGVLWSTILRYAASGAPVQVMDLARPADEGAAMALQARHVGDAPKVLRDDFYNSLLAAFEPAEVEAQLADAGIKGWQVDMVTDRHMIVSGRAP